MIQACTVTAWLYRQAQPLAQAYPGTTLADLRAMSLRDIANLLYWRESRSAPDDERSDPHEDPFGEMR